MVYVLSRSKTKNPNAKIRPHDDTSSLERSWMMNEGRGLELVEGTSNVFSDLGDPDADHKHAKASLAAAIISVLDDSGLSVQDAGEATGFTATDYSRVRNANIDHFAIDHLMHMLSALQAAAKTTAPMP